MNRWRHVICDRCCEQRERVGLRSVAPTRAFRTAASGPSLPSPASTAVPTPTTCLVAGSTAGREPRRAAEDGITTSDDHRDRAGVAQRAAADLPLLYSSCAGIGRQADANAPTAPPVARPHDHDRPTELW